jgi:hypothetical protein
LELKKKKKKKIWWRIRKVIAPQTLPTDAVIDWIKAGLKFRIKKRFSFVKIAFIPSKYIKQMQPTVKFKSRIFYSSTVLKPIF